MLPILPQVVMPPVAAPVPTVDLTQGGIGPMLASAAPVMPPPQAPTLPVVGPATGAAPASPAPQPGFLDLLKTDPRLQMMLLAFGANMMQPYKADQGALGHFAESVLKGAGTGMQIGEQMRKANLEERRVKAAEKGVSLEERRVAEGEKTGAANRTAIQQKIDQNAKTFPALIKKLDAEIDNLATEGKLKTEQAAFWKERARLYPQEVNADLIKAKKGTGMEEMFQKTAEAMAKTEGVSVEEATARLGQQYFGRVGKAAAGVQNLAAYKQEWKIANPRQESETPQAYEQRASTEALRMVRESKTKGYFQSKMDYLKYSLDREKDAADFDRYWVGAGNELPEVDPAKTAENLPRDKGGKVDAKALRDGGVYNIQTKSYTGPAKWDAKQQKLIPVSR